jgi:hypothetical protein
MAALFPENKSPAHWISGWVGARPGLDMLEEKESLARNKNFNLSKNLIT